MSTQFTKKHIGTPCVFAGFDGESYSATIDSVKGGIVRVKYFPHSAIKTRAGDFILLPVIASLNRHDWGRLTLYPEGSKFLKHPQPFNVEQARVLQAESRRVIRAVFEQRVMAAIKEAAAQGESYTSVIVPAALTGDSVLTKLSELGFKASLFRSSKNLIVSWDKTGTI